MKCSLWQLGESLPLQWKKVHAVPKFPEKMFMDILWYYEVMYSS